MKTAVSVPDELFAQVERLARGTGRSRSEVYSAALREYVARHGPDEVTEALNRVVVNVEESDASRGFRDATARRILRDTEW